MEKIKAGKTIFEQTEDFQHYKEVGKEAYLNLSEKEAHAIVTEAVTMLETFMVNFNDVNMDVYELGGILDRFERANNVVAALRTLNQYKKLNNR